MLYLVCYKIIGRELVLYSFAIICLNWCRWIQFNYKAWNYFKDINHHMLFPFFGIHYYFLLSYFLYFDFVSCYLIYIGFFCLYIYWFAKKRGHAFIFWTTVCDSKFTLLHLHEYLLHRRGNIKIKQKRYICKVVYIK